MKTIVISALVGFAAAILVGNAGIASGPAIVDLAEPGEALLIRLNGKPAGGLRVDAQGRLGIFGPNHTSTIVTIDARDRVQIDPHPVDSPAPRLTIDQDVWLTGVLRVGRADAFGDAPFDPNGAVQVGRNLPTAQPMALLRAFAQGKESFRLGADADGNGYWSDGAHDTPLVTFQPSAAGNPKSGKVLVYGAPINY
ncbi:MAG: hypothetical protein HUU46_23745 [Candidatus Hydrogenedentes bacterium]|nr:hypothetical protein [Candidatus Hydrogenedentota bacterium]